MEQIRLGSGVRKIHDVELEIEFHSGEAPLLLQGSEAGKLPMRPTVTFGEKYYFDVPQDLAGTKVSVDMDNAGFLAGDEEFEFQVPTRYQEVLEASGSKGNVLTLRLVRASQDQSPEE